MHPTAQSLLTYLLAWPSYLIALLNCSLADLLTHLPDSPELAGIKAGGAKFLGRPAINRLRLSRPEASVCELLSTKALLLEFLWEIARRSQLRCREADLFESLDAIAQRYELCRWEGTSVECGVRSEERGVRSAE